MTYRDPADHHSPTTGSVAPASWGNQIRTNLQAHEYPPSCRVRHNTTQSVAHANWVTLAANTEDWDTASMHSVSSNTSRITITVTGKYLLCATAQFSANGTGSRGFRFAVNGVAGPAFHFTAVTGAVSGNGSGTTMRNLTAGAYVEVQAYQNSGGTLTGQLWEFAATRIGG